MNFIYDARCVILGQNVPCVRFTAKKCTVWALRRPHEDEEIELTSSTPLEDRLLLVLTAASDGCPDFAFFSNQCLFPP